MVYIGKSDNNYITETESLRPIVGSGADEDIRLGTDDYDRLDTSGKCTLPSALVLPKSEDGSYTPTSPQSTILNILSAVPADDYDQYCRGWHQLNTRNPPYNYNRNGECGNWQEKYIALHKHRLNQLEALKAHNYKQLDGQDRPTYIAYKCIQVATNGNRGCGGLADRMSGKEVLLMFYRIPCTHERVWVSVV